MINPPGQDRLTNPVHTRFAPYGSPIWYVMNPTNYLPQSPYHLLALCRRALILLALSLFLVLGMGGGNVQAMSVQREVLPNGLTVINVDRRDTNAVHMLALVRAGPGEEGALLGTGISRVLQTMILANARERSSEMARLGDQLSIHGGQFLDHGWSSDQSAFALSTTDSSFSDGLRLLARLLSRPNLSEDHLRTSHTLLNVGSERDQRSAPETALRHLASLVFRDHPARIPSRGLANLRQSLSLEAIRDYHRRFYTSNRITLIIVGNVGGERVLREAGQAFADLATGDWSPPTALSEPVQFASRERFAPSPDSREYRLYGWRTPSLNFYNDHAALELIAILLQHRLEERLLSERDGHRLASHIQVSSLAAARAPGLFTIAFRPGPVAGDEAWFAVQSALDALRQDGPSSDELTTAKRLWARRYAQTLAGVAGAARDLARWEQAVGVPGFGQVYRSTIAGIDATVIKRVTNSLLHPKGANLSTVTLSPNEQDNAGEGAANGANGLRSTITDIVPRTESLPHGARLIHRYMPVGLAHVRVTMRAGASIEPEGLYGATDLLSKLLTYGPTGRINEDFSRLLTSYGMRLEVQATPHYLELHIVCFPQDVDQALAILVDLLKQPALPEAALERTVAEEIARLNTEPNTWQDRLIRSIDQGMLSDHYAYRARSELRESLSAINRERLLAWQQQLSVGENLVFSVYGDYDSSDIAKRLAALLDAEPLLRRGQAPQPTERDWSTIQPPAVTTMTSEAGKEALALVWRGPDFANAPALGPAVEILSALLSGHNGRGGRLAGALSDLGIDPEDSLVSHRRMLAGRGYWAILVKVPDGQLEAVRERILAEVDEVVRALTSSTPEHQALLTANEISAALSLASNARILSMEDQGRASVMHARSVLRGASLEHELAYRARLANVERSDLARAASRYLAAPPIMVQMAAPQNVPEPTQPGGESIDDEPSANDPDNPTTNDQTDGDKNGNGGGNGGGPEAREARNEGQSESRNEKSPADQDSE